MSIHDEARRVLERVVQMTRLTHSVQQHLTIEQRDAVAASANNDDGPSGSGIGDPTFAAMRAIAPYAAWERRIYSTLRHVDRALDDAERTMQSVLSESARKDAIVPAEPRCPGWNDELRARLGGCGKVIETYRLANGQTVNRPEGLCAGCRTAKRRADSDEAA